MSNKTNRLAKNLLAAMSLLGAGGAVMPGVSAAEKAATTKTETKAKAETGKKEAAKPAANANKGMSPIVPAIALVTGLVGGGAVGKFALGGGSGDIKTADGKSVDYDMTALVKISQGETDALVKKLGADGKNVTNGTFESIAYAVAEASVLHKVSAAVGTESLGVNIVHGGKILPKVTAREANGYYAAATTANAVTEDIPTSVEWNFEVDKLNKKDAGADNVNLPGNDLMLSINATNPLLAASLVRTKARVKLEKAAEPNAKCKLTITVGGKTITMTDIAADGKYKDTKVEVKAAAAPAA